MINLWRVIRISRVLDDRTDRSSRAAAELDDQGRVDAELADARALPWKRPSRQMKSRVLLEIEARRYATPQRLQMPVWPLRIAVAAAALLMVWNLPVVRRALTGPQGILGNQAALTPDSDDDDFDPALIAGVVARSGPMFEAGLDDPLRQEAQAITDDTRRAAELVLGRLPLDGGW